MSNFIEEFYYGNIEPQEMSTDLSSRLKKKLSKLAEKEEQLTTKLTAEEKELFLSYAKAYNEFSTIGNSDSFITGFRLGARFTYDTFVSNGKDRIIMDNNTKLEYRRVGDYMIPNLTLPPEEAKVRLGKWGMLHKDYMLKHKKVTVTIMTAEGRFWQYLAEVEKQAEEMFSRLVNDMAKTEGATEQLKAENQMLWVQKMNNIEARAREVVTTELIYI